MNRDQWGDKPHYPFVHQGAVLVCGSAWTLFDDIKKARQHFSDAPCIAVKDASAYVKAIGLFGLHPSKFGRMRKQQERINNNEFFIHTSEWQKEFTKFNYLKKGEYDYYWPGIGGVNSGWGGVRLAKEMGFTKVIMCGIPLSKGGYIGGKFSRVFQNDKVIEIYRNQVLRDTKYHENVFSMSGWTREFFGDYLSNSES